MQKRAQKNSIALVAVTLVLGILACAPSTKSQDTDLDLAASQTMEALGKEPALGRFGCLCKH